MREVWLDYMEKLNKTETILVFKTLFNRQEYGTYTVINIAAPIPEQDEAVERAVTALQNMKREDAYSAKKVE